MKYDREAYSVKQFASLMGLNPRTVAVNATRAPDRLPKITRVGRSIRFLRPDIEEFINNQHN